MSFCTDIKLGKFEVCIVNTLLNLSSTALQQLQNLLRAQIPILDALICEAILSIGSADLQTQQLRIQSDIAQQAITQAKSTLNSIPLGTLDTACTDWAIVNGSINSLFQNEIFARADQLLQEFKRATSIQSEASALKAEYEEQKQLLLDFISLLDSIILEAKCREAKA
jgi:hypothetical protein